MPHLVSVISICITEQVLAVLVALSNYTSLEMLLDLSHIDSSPTEKNPLPCIANFIADYVKFISVFSYVHYQKRNVKEL